MNINNILKIYEDIENCLLVSLDLKKNCQM